MARERVQLDSILNSICSHVYFQPPEGHKMVYPCIVYDGESDFTLDADNRIYNRQRKYTITAIDWDPESIIAEQVGETFQIRLERHFKNDNLHHFVYTLIW